MCPGDDPGAHATLPRRVTYCVRPSLAHAGIVRYRRRSCCPSTSGRHGEPVRRPAPQACLSCAGLPFPSPPSLPKERRPVQYLGSCRTTSGTTPALRLRMQDEHPAWVVGPGEQPPGPTREAGVAGVDPALRPHFCAPSARWICDAVGLADARAGSREASSSASPRVSTRCPGSGPAAT